MTRWEETTSREDSPSLKRTDRIGGRITTSKQHGPNPPLHPGELFSGSAMCISRATRDTHHALLPGRDHAVLDPNAVASHLVGEHHVGCQAIPHDGNLARRGDACLGVVLEVGHDLVTAAWLLDPMGKDWHAGGPLYLKCQLSISIPAGGASRVGHDEQSSSWICFPQSVKPFLPCQYQPDLRHAKAEVEQGLCSTKRKLWQTAR